MSAYKRKLKHNKRSKLTKPKKLQNNIISETIVQKRKQG